MGIRFSSTVLITRRFGAMKRFYTEMLGQQVTLDFGSCVTLECALTIWELREGHALAQSTRQGGNADMEICFETEDFDADAARILAAQVPLVHGITEEAWGQRTLRFRDPDGNIVELGESIPCFCRRLHACGLDADAVARKTGVAPETVRRYLQG
jgi:catechol 2,3-dioxygenase-like lactoylglutathione lyase family enzyme